VLIQWPVESHVWIVLPEHWSSFGTHTPPHLFVVVSHANVQVVVAPQCPFASQVWSIVAEPAMHRVSFGLHSPVQSPLPVHTNWQAVWGWSTPIASQRRGVSFGPQIFDPGRHVPVQAVLAPDPLHR
jgi:hypothetical protein